MKYIVDIDHLTKKYNTSKTFAINDISLQVEPGEFFTFLGPNGAGKTTTISILNTTLSKTSGNVTVAGFDIDSQSNEVRRSIGVIFQSPSTDSNLTAEENIRFHATLYGVYPFSPLYSLMPKTYKKQVMDLAEMLGIAREIHNPIKTFSGGMRRKLEIIRSLIHHPVILFLDEPTTGLDPESRRNLWEYLQGVRREHGTTIFLTTHYLDEAESADRVCIIAGGKVISLTTPNQLKKELMVERLVVDVAKKDRSTLLKNLQSMELELIGDGPVTISIQKKSIQEILTQLSQKKIQVESLQVHSPSLEQAYISVIDKYNKSLVEKS